MTTAERVVREANLIAREFAVLGSDRAISATVDHIRKFWAPLLRTTLLAEATAHREKFSPIAIGAVDRLAA